MSIPLKKGATVVLGPTGAGQVTLGPTVGPPRWNVTSVAVRTGRPGQRPVPRFTLYVDSADANGLVDLTYDGSSDATVVQIQLLKGQQLIGVWTGGQAGDVATMSVYGTASS
ncbi:hypothetical protein AB0D63_43280 [Kitasatospora sp. NPDC048343]|uniref:hypothetical protein n=1 Tax=Kitasatospora sp. NPDC048343 TaxID=3154717 RepID=UPI0033F368D8